MTTSTSGSSAPDVFLTELHVSNVKKITKVDLVFDPKAGTWVISGDNGNGKTSLLDAIRMALGGKSEIPTMPIRIGEETADVILVVSTADGKPYAKIHRKFRGENSYLEVTDERGSVVKSPQEVLKSLLGVISLKPGEFAEPHGCKTPAQENEERLNLLLAMSQMPIDIRAFDAETEALRSQRTAAHRDRDAAAKKLLFEGDLPVIPPEPSSPADLSALEKELSEAEQTVREHARHVEWANAKRAEMDSLTSRIAALQEDYQRVKGIWETHRNNANIKPPDVEPIKAKVVAARERNAVANAAVAERAVVVERVETWKAAIRTHGELDLKVKKRDEERTSALTGAKFPIPGITILPGGEVAMKMKGGEILPFAQLSTAQKWIASFALLAAARPHLRLVLIENGNDFDLTTLERLTKAAQVKGLQVLIERVARDVPGHILIEEGKVAGAAVPAGGAA